MGWTDEVRVSGCHGPAIEAGNAFPIRTTSRHACGIDRRLRCVVWLPRGVVDTPTQETSATRLSWAFFSAHPMP